ncbi:speckle-type POZ protein B-like [Musca autumnalis]|uniref:speckle-type POZ protein B-like n=1 Tax=Musca autumnalis TaxID=221902 RepID=UPI003CEE7AC4
MSSTNTEVGTMEKIRNNRYIWRIPLTGSILNSPVINVYNDGIKSEWKLFVNRTYVLDNAYADFTEVQVKLISSDSKNAQFQVIVLISSNNKLQQIINDKMSMTDKEKSFDTLTEKATEYHFTVNAITGPTLTDDIAKILSSEEYSDVTLVAQGDVTFKAHKMILCARSVVFAAMFRNDLEESRKNRIEIKDMDANVMKEMLTNIYTDSEVPKEMAEKLFCVAHKYALFNLQKMCEKLLIDAIEVASAVDTLLLAEKHSSLRLKVSAVEFIIQHIKDVIKTESWKTLQKTHHELYVVILETIVQRLL